MCLTCLVNYVSNSFCYKMTRRITCYVVLFTLMWGAHTEDEEKMRDLFKSNMTRNDFSSLLQSLIKLNEHRVSVLQKLYRLEDYGVLSEVLRSGDKKTGNGNANNFFLVVMSKNPNNPSRRKVGFQVVDSIMSLDAGNNKIHPKLDFVLDPAGYITQNIRKENGLETVFGNVPRVYGLTKTHRADDKNKKIATTKMLNHAKPGLRTKVKHDTVKNSLKANEDRKYHKENSRFEIVSNKGSRPNANDKLLDYDGNSNKYPQTVGYNSQSKEYHEIDFTVENHNRTTKPIIIKHILSSNHKHSKYPLKDNDEQDKDDLSPFSKIENDHNSQYTKTDRDISIKKLHVKNHHNPKTNKYTLKVKVQRNKQNDKLTPKPIMIKYIKTSNQTTKYSLEGKNEQDEDDYDSPFSKIQNDHNSQYSKMDPIKKLHVNKHLNPKISKYTPKVEVQRNQQNDKRLTKPIIIKDIITSNHQNTKYTIADEEKQNEDYYGNIEIDHNSQYNNKFSTLASETIYSSKPVIPDTAKDTQYESYLGFEDHKDVRDNSINHKLKTTIGTTLGNFHGFEHYNNVVDNLNEYKPYTAKELHYRDNLNAESKKDTDYYGVKMFDNGKRSGETFSIFITNVGNGTAEEFKQQNDPKLILNAFGKPESKPIARKPFVKCLNKKALKLCSKSCISAYKNVCRRLKCTSRSKKALKSECKRSCRKTFASSSSKYSNENSDGNDENSDYCTSSTSDDDYS